MRKKTQIKASFLVLLLCCFAVNDSYCQQTTTSNSNNQLISAKLFFNYLPETKSSTQITVVPYLLPDPLLSVTQNTEEAISNATISTDTININDTVSLVSNDQDSIDTKEANANSITIPDIATHYDIKTDDGTGNMPAVLSDKKIERLITKYAEMISLEPEDVKNYPLYKFINDWYGVKYKWGGTDNSGIDCSAFSQKLYGSIYGTNIQRTARQQHKSSEKIRDYDEANEGDLVFFRIHHIRISHVGVYLANGYFVHASRSKGVVISNLDDKYWRSRYAGCGRITKPERAATESDFAQ